MAYLAICDADTYGSIQETLYYISNYLKILKGYTNVNFLYCFKHTHNDPVPYSFSHPKLKYIMFATYC